MRPLAGRRVLELGAGTGELAARLAEAVGPDGSVLASDVADGHGRAAAQTRLAGHADGRGRAASTPATIPLPDDSVDVVVFRMGLMLCPSPRSALREIRRVLRPGGRVGRRRLGRRRRHNPWMTSVGMAAMMHGLVQGGPPVGPGGPFSLADPVDLERRVRGAGFTDVSVTGVDSTRPFRTRPRHVEVVGALAPPLAAALGDATPEQLAAVRGTVAELTRSTAKATASGCPRAPFSASPAS